MNMGHGRLFSFAGSGYATAVTAEDAKVIDILHALCFIFLAILNLKFIIIIMQKVSASHHMF